MTKNTKYTSLKSFWCIAKSERHFSIGKHAIETYEGCFLLIFRCNLYLVISRITIKEDVEFVPGHSLQDLIMEWEREVVFAGDNI